MLDFLFRFDANKRVGAGHLQRALGLMQALQKQSFHVACTGHYEETYRALLEQHKIRYYSITTVLACRCLVFDHYAAFDDYLSGGVVFSKMVVFEDLPTRLDSRAGLVINAFGDPQDLASRYPHAEVLCGLDYLLFREEVSRLLKQTKQAQIKCPTHKGELSILLSLGGADQSSLVQQMAELLDMLVHAKVNISVLSPVPVNVPERCSLEVGYFKDFLEKTCNSDLVICGLGQTFLEMLVLGNPCIGLVLADNQQGCATMLKTYTPNILDGRAELGPSLKRLLSSNFEAFLKPSVRIPEQNKTGMANHSLPASTIGIKKEQLINKMVALIQ